MRNPMIMIGYLLGGAMVVIGLLVTIGQLTLRGDVDPMLGTIFGIVILLFGCYRLAVTDMKRRTEARQRRDASGSASSPGSHPGHVD